jgi:hypothetical protein
MLPLPRPKSRRKKTSPPHKERKHFDLFQFNARVSISAKNRWLSGFASEIYK